MTCVITALCTHEGDCVEVCPVDCIVPGPKDDPNWGDLYYIDADTYIDCEACVPVCPPKAIFAEDDVPPEYENDVTCDAAVFREGTGYWDFDLEIERRPHSLENVSKTRR